MGILPDWWYRVHWARLTYGITIESSVPTWRQTRKLAANTRIQRCDGIGDVQAGLDALSPGIFASELYGQLWTIDLSVVQSSAAAQANPVHGRGAGADAMQLW